jgi:predicted site-specific integrase-resolvase
MVTPDEAAQLCQVSTRTIYRRIETGRFHFTETEKGFSLICLRSLESNANSVPGYAEEAATQPLRGFFRNGMKRMLRRR